MRFIGIDPGAQGGIVIINKSGVIEFVEVMNIVAEELDVNWFTSFLKEHGLTDTKDIIVLLEKGQAMPGNGVASIYKYGEHNGMLKAVLSMLKIPFELIAPQIWTRIMHIGCTANKPKDKSRQAAKRLFPEADLRDPNKSNSTRMHEGILDALMIAEYGRRKWIKT